MRAVDPPAGAGVLTFMEDQPMRKMYDLGALAVWVCAPVIAR